ncbi:calcium-binding protein [uncultured Roseobacter sp.]|uniref:calcium-binding protein n=1 Tax=uncultured Roseobacter sp. TaxID=114847 RepID=UPI0026201D52|nr:calcium-binding protein [uncultured Roseobacter sp.]
MAAFNLNNLPSEKIVELSALARASYGNELPPPGWTTLTGSALGFVEGSNTGTYAGDTFQGSSNWAGAPAARVYKKGTEITISFRGTDSIADYSQYPDILSNNYINAFTSFLDSVAEYMANEVNGISKVNVVGHSLGAAAANILRNLSATQNDGAFDNATYLTIATPKVSTNPDILNIGFENDWVFKAIPRNSPFSPDIFSSTTDNIIYYDDEYAASNWPGSLFDFTDVSAHGRGLYVESIGRITSSVFYEEMDRDSTIIVVATDAQVSNKDTSTSDHFGSDAFFVGRDADDDILGGNGIDKIDAAGGNDILRGAAGDDILRGGNGDDELYDEAGFDLLFGGDDDDVVYTLRDLGPDSQSYDYDSEPPETGFLTDVYDGGKGEDTLEIVEFNEVRAGLVDGELAFALGSAEIGAVDLAFNFEVLNNAEIIDFTALDGGFTYDGVQSTVSAAGSTVKLNNHGSITGSEDTDIFNLGSNPVTINGGGGDDTFIGGDGSVLRGGNGADTFFGGLGAVIDGGSGNDVITSGGGGSTLSGGTGADTISALSGDALSGDAEDTLTLEGIQISGDDVMFGMDGSYRLNSGGDNSPDVDALLSKSFAIMVRPAAFQFGFDGTQASIIWEGFVILNPDLNVHFSQGGYFQENTADATIVFKMGDFGINGGGLVSDRNLDTFQFTSGDQTVVSGSLPVGTITGTVFDDTEEEFNGTFEQYAGFESSELASYYEQRSQISAPSQGNLDLSSASGATTISNFDFETTSVSLDGTPLDINNLPTPVSASQQGADVQIAFGSGSFATFVNTDLAAWQSAATDDVFGTDGSDVLSAGDGDNLISSGSGNDTVDAGAGNDSIIYTAGNDSLSSGNTGNDILDLTQFQDDDVSFRVSGSDVIIATPAGEITLVDQVADPLGSVNSNIETVFFSNASLDEAAIRQRSLRDQTTAGDDVVDGTAYDDQIVGTGGNDTIFAGDGNDLISYLSGDDVISEMNAGSDTLDLSQFVAEQVIFREVGDDVLIETPVGTIRLENQLLHAVGSPLSNIETVLFDGSTLDETGIRDKIATDLLLETDLVLNGDENDNLLSGAAGDDVLNGGAGNDELNGGNGDDILNGGSGADTIDGGSGSDTASYEGATSAITVSLATGSGTLGDALGDTLTGVENLIGSAFADNLSGNSGANSLAGAGGDDTLNGGDGADTLEGGLGNDALNGGEDSDTYVYRSGDGSDTIFDRANSNQSAVDVFRFADLNADQVSFSHVRDDMRNLIMTTDAGDAITWEYHFLDHQKNAVEQIIFADGTTLNQQQIRDKSVQDMKVATAYAVGTDLAENYVHTAGDGSYRIYDRDDYFATATDTFTFADLNIDQVTFAHNRNDKEKLVMTTDAGEVITWEWHFLDHQKNAAEQIVFADGTTLNQQQIRDKSVQDMKVGTAYAVGTDLAENYVHTTGDGSYRVYDRDDYFATATDTFTFADLNIDQVTFAHNRNDKEKLVMTTDAGEVITWEWHFLDHQKNAAEQIVFADGTTLNQQQIRDKSVQDMKVAAAYAVGTDLAENYVHTAGDGSYRIYDRDDYFASSTDTFNFADLNSDQVWFSNAGGDDNNLVMKTSSGETITWQYHFLDHEKNAVEQIMFADGVSLNLNTIKAKALIGSNTSDRLIGFDTNDTMSGNDGDDYVFGSSGNDVILGGAGNDELRGGTGDDIHHGGEGDDEIIAWTGNDVLNGDAGDDYLDGGEGNDDSYGGAGNDYILGTAGDDYFDGGSGTDTLDFTYTGTGVTYDLSLGTITFAHGFVEYFTGFENILTGSGNSTVYGDAANNEFTGGAGNDILHGGDGNDILNGLGGNDMQYGGAGDDLLIANFGADFFDGGTGFDTLDFRFYQFSATFDLANEVVNLESGNTETVASIENVIASIGNDTLLGTDVSNILTGGQGNDILTGGADADTFVFMTGDGNDTITDFVTGVDLIHFEGTGLGFAELTITENQGDAVVDYGGDQIVLTGITGSSLTSDSFTFV